jgi:Mrp family chromosome partitioning ATPase
MSRNFELLQRIGREQALYANEPVAATELVPEADLAAGQPGVFAEPQPSSLVMADGEVEEITKLVQRLFIVPGNDSPRSVVFTAPERGTGCSWVCARVAEILARQVAGSVCVVDANLRSPGLHSQFGAGNEQGLADALTKADPVRNFARNLSRSNLWLLSSGSSSEGAQNLLTSDRMRLRFSELRAEFDYVLVDAASMSESNDAVLLGSGCEGVVLVLKANSSRRESARTAIHDLENAKARVLGAVLNQRTFPIPDSIYKKL